MIVKSKNDSNIKLFKFFHTKIMVTKPLVFKISYFNEVTLKEKILLLINNIVISFFFPGWRGERLLNANCSFTTFKLCSIFLFSLLLNLIETKTLDRPKGITEGTHSKSTWLC